MVEEKTAVRYSKKREAMLHELKETTTHPSAEWLFQRLKPSFPDLSLGTVYRNLAFFQERGQIRSVGVVNGQERYDADVSEHCHFICDDCGKVVDLHDVTSVVSHQLERDYGFTVTKQDLKLYGQCGDCKRKQKMLS